MGDITMTEDDVVVPAILASHLDGLQDDFGNDSEEKRAGGHSSRAHADLERAPGKADNWVEKAGGLPKYIERIAKHLHYDQGMTISQAIATAINTVKRWAKGGGDVKPDTVAKAQAALAQWEKMKAGRKDFAPDAVETKGVEYKNVSVKGLQVADADTGIVEAIVSVTGIVDEVKDIIKPGAYAKTLAKRTPKGVYSHSWDQPISRTLDIKELMPGDPRLPKQMSDGTPWPAAAGALWVKMQFNLDTERGRTAFSDVKFFGDEQEWSIGYNVPVGGAKVNPKAGVREIDYLDLFEYSPVLFGAMPLAATQSVKTAQTAFKEMQKSQGQWTVPDWTVEEKTETPDDTVLEAVADSNQEPIELAENATDVESNLDPDEQVGVFEVDENGMVEADLDEYEEIEAEDTGMKALFGPDDLDIVVKALNALNDLLGTATGHKVHSQVPGNEVAEESSSGEPSSIADAVTKWLDGDEELMSAAEALDEALGSSDEESIESAANAFLDLVEARMDGADEKTAEALTKTAKLVAQMIESASGKEPPSETGEEKSALPPVAAWDDDDFEDDENVETLDLSTLSRLRATLDGNS